MTANWAWITIGESRRRHPTKEATKMRLITTLADLMLRLALPKTTAAAVGCTVRKCACINGVLYLQCCFPGGVACTPCNPTNATC